VGGERRKVRAVRRYKADVIEALKDLKRQVDDGVVPDRTRSVEQFLDWWLDTVMVDQVSPDSLSEYRKRVRRMTPVIGNVKVGKLTTGHVQQVARHLTVTYPRSAKTRSTTLATLRQALTWAMTATPPILYRNPAEGVKSTGVEVAKTDDALDADEAKAVLAAARGDDLYPLVWFALKYGVRLGELLNLRWTDIDDAKEEMTVRKSKTAAGVRTLPLTDEAKAVIAAHRKAAKVMALDGHVFTDAVGVPRKPQGTRVLWSGLLEKAGISHMCRNCGSGEACSTAVRRFHASRHTAATLLLEAGVALEVVSAILGHASIKITADIYAKVRNDLKRKGLVSI
jgi:integrase